MTRTLTINQNQLSYFARLTRPATSLLGNHQKTIAALIDVFSEYNVELANFHTEGVGSNPSSIGVNVNLGSFGVYKVKADRIEWIADNFVEEVIEKFPRVLQAGSEWLRSALNVTFKTQWFAYFCHAKLSEGNAEEFFLTLRDVGLFNFGRSLGSGIISNWFDDVIGGRVKLLIDHSVVVEDGLHAQILIRVDSDVIDYTKVCARGLEVFYQALSNVGLEVEREVPFDNKQEGA
jgi:hypothetical protein